ncbi:MULTISPECIES: HAD-IA family hydrolase [unclassified Crossiella]|uniref:HAD-IA family hydrolase n=1 Tax=unclassified Crossiella TaxID=2620835 RepID=UPI001FFE6941|nr:MULTISPECIES: HAD-IA family hydrolase [unclassified Crossiella]MCK2243903.1 HAD-IA family hydrolase [Crossiella sp. S99.2]MCK2257239.1 HAD-IA family hydrolase [Crossiella sp. S99.1]
MDLVALLVDYGGVLTDWGDDPAASEPPLLAVLRRARAAGLRTALLSNAEGPGPDPDSPFGALFDTMVLSGEVGIAKPDERVYLLTADRLGLAPGQCVFVDDLPGNVRAAAATGMVGVHHTSVARTVEELETLFERKLGG